MQCQCPFGFSCLGHYARLVLGHKDQYDTVPVFPERVVEFFAEKKHKKKGLREIPGSLCIGGQRRGPEHGYYESPKKAIGIWHHWGVITNKPKALSADSKISMTFPKKQEQERDGIKRRTKETTTYQMCSQSSVVELSWWPIIIRPAVVCQVILCNPVGFRLPTTSLISSTLSLLFPSPLNEFTNTVSTYNIM